MDEGIFLQQIKGVIQLYILAVFQGYSVMYSRMEEDNRWGSGIYGGFDNLEKLFFQAFNALFAIGMLIPILLENQGGKHP